MIAQIRPAELQQWLQTASTHCTQDTTGTPATPVVLDVREPHELQLASVQANGFTLLTIPMNSIPSRLAELDPAQPIACLCHHGSRSMQVASFLQSRGFTQLANIAGGIHAWSQEVDPSIARY